MQTVRVRIAWAVFASSIFGAALWMHIWGGKEIADLAVAFIWLVLVVLLGLFFTSVSGILSLKQGYWTKDNIRRADRCPIVNLFTHRFEAYRRACAAVEKREQEEE